MEENFMQSNSDVEEEQFSLLSYKIRELREKVIQNSYSSKTLSLLQRYSKKDSILEDTIVSTSRNAKQPTRLESELHPSSILKNYSVPISSNPSSLKNHFQSKTDRTRKSRELRKSNRSSNNKGKKTESHLKFVQSTSQGGRRTSIFQPYVYQKKQVDGEGALFFQNGTSIESYWFDGEPFGQSKIRYPNRAVYTGSVYNYKSHGLGTLSLPRGTKYVGEFCEGEPHGQGTYYGPNDQVLRKGEWRRGKYQG